MSTSKRRVTPNEALGAAVYALNNAMNVIYSEIHNVGPLHPKFPRPAVLQSALDSLGKVKELLISMLK